MRLELEQLLKGDVSFDYHSKVRPNACEASAVKSALELISRLEVRAHFCHLSTLEAVGMIRKEKYLAKRENKKPLFTCEVTPHHLFLSTRDWERLRLWQNEPTSKE